MWALMVKCRIKQVLSLNGCFRLAHTVLYIAAGPPLQTTANITLSWRDRCPLLAVFRCSSVCQSKNSSL